jgi:hypothetical protein
LTALIPAICQCTRDEFGETAELTLQVYDDPEEADRYLVLFVRLPAYEPKMRRRLDAIWDRFEPDLRGISGWIILTTDFRKVGAHAV